MTWVRLDDQFPDHPKVASAGPLAGWLHICGLCYAGRYLTDGFIPTAVIVRLADFTNIGISHGMIGHDVEPEELVERLVEVGLWEVTDGGYQIHDYLEYNPSAEQVKTERTAARERMAQVREKQARTKKGTFAGSSPEVQENFAGSSENVTPSPSPTPINKERESIEVKANGKANGAVSPLPKLTTAQQDYFGAVCVCLGWDYKTLDAALRGQVAQAAGALQKAGYSLDELHRFPDYWRSHWPGSKGDYPTIKQLRAEIGKLRATGTEKPYATEVY